MEVGEWSDCRVQMHAQMEEHLEWRYRGPVSDPTKRTTGSRKTPHQAGETRYHRHRSGATSASTRGFRTSEPGHQGRATLFLCSPPPFTEKTNNRFPVLDSRDHKRSLVVTSDPEVERRITPIRRTHRDGHVLGRVIDNADMSLMTDLRPSPTGLESTSLSPRSGERPPRPSILPRRAERRPAPGSAPIHPRNRSRVAPGPPCGVGPRDPLRHT